MRVLFVITRAERGGAQVHVLDLVSNLPAHFEPIVAAGEDGLLLEHCRKLGVPVHIVPALVQPIRPWKDAKALLALAKLFRSEKPDLIHAHTSKAGLLARLAGRITGIPVAFTVHTWSFADGLPFFQRCIAIPLEWFAAALGGKIITVSKANQSRAENLRIGRKKDLLTIWNGIPDSPHRAKPGTHPVTRLIMVARFVPQKDHHTLLHALAEIPGNWTLRLVGDGPCRKEIESLAATLGLSQRIEFLGDRSDIAELLADSDIFLLSSKWEGLPLSILEAMRAGLPVVASNVGGVSEAVTDGVTGFLVPPQDISQLRARLLYLMDSRERLTELGHNGRSRYDADFKIESMVKRTVSVYEQSARPRIQVALDESFSNSR